MGETGWDEGCTALTVEWLTLEDGIRDYHWATSEQTWSCGAPLAHAHNAGTGSARARLPGRTPAFNNAFVLACRGLLLELERQGSRETAMGRCSLSHPNA